jgi:hypothetical protein
MGISARVPTEDPAIARPRAVVRWRRNHLGMIQLVDPREPPLLKMDITTPYSRMRKTMWKVRLSRMVHKPMRVRLIRIIFRPPNLS